MSHLTQYATSTLTVAYDDWLERRSREMVNLMVYGLSHPEWAYFKPDAQTQTLLQEIHDPQLQGTTTDQPSTMFATWLAEKGLQWNPRRMRATHQRRSQLRREAHQP